MSVSAWNEFLDASCLIFSAVVICEAGRKDKHNRRTLKSAGHVPLMLITNRPAQQITEK